MRCCTSHKQAAGWLVALVLSSLSNISSCDTGLGWKRRIQKSVHQTFGKLSKRNDDAIFVNDRILIDMILGQTDESDDHEAFHGQQRRSSRSCHGIFGLDTSSKQRSLHSALDARGGSGYDQYPNQHPQYHHHQHGHPAQHQQPPGAATTNLDVPPSYYDDAAYYGGEGDGDSTATTAAASASVSTSDTPPHADSYPSYPQQQQQHPPPYQQPPNPYGDALPPPLPSDDSLPPDFPDDAAYGAGVGGGVMDMDESMVGAAGDPAMPGMQHREAGEYGVGDSLMEQQQSWDTSGTSSSAENALNLENFDKEYILKGLARLYRKKILPLELASRYGHFHSPPLSPSDFDSPPMILLLGQYSVGKTSFVKYLLGRDFPGIRVGPEPTTDRFTTVLWGPQDKIIPGAALCSQADRPFTGLSPFGNNFLSRLEGCELNAPLLRNITIVDTPGILSGQKQRSRNYDYEAVMKWFAERADLIIIMFDAHKLDISDELKSVMSLMIPHLDKIRIVLNKADSISTQQLMRVYGALMWSLGKVMNTPEVCRVYMGSFWDAPLQNSEQAELLQREEMDLLQDIMQLPQQAVMRRINEMVKRARSVKVHAYIIHYLRKQLPYTWGKREKQRRLIGRLESEFLAAARRYGLPKGDFPPLESMRDALYEIKDLSEFPKLDKRLVRDMEKIFTVDVPQLLEKAKNQ